MPLRLGKPKLRRGPALSAAPKNDNHDKALPTKLELRRGAIVWVGGPEQAYVLDLFAGRGQMHRLAWQGSAGYLGNEKDLAKVLVHPAPCHHAKAAQLLASIDLQPFNVADFDPYGNPWEELIRFANRRRLAPGERLALTITDGTPRLATFGTTVHALAKLIDAPTRAPGGHRRWPEMAREGLSRLAGRMGGELVSLRAPEIGARGMFYALALMCGTASASTQTGTTPANPE